MTCCICKPFWSPYASAEVQNFSGMFFRSFPEDLRESESAWVSKALTMEELRLHRSLHGAAAAQKLPNCRPPGALYYQLSNAFR
jgi:hypothetical protein